MTASFKIRLLKGVLPLAIAALFATTAHAEVPAPQDIAYPGTIVLKVDATNLSQQMFRMNMSMPVKPGPMTMLYPQWLPANHGPNNVLEPAGRPEILRQRQAASSGCAIPSMCSPFI